MATGRSETEKTVLRETIHTCNRGTQEDKVVSQQYRLGDICDINSETLETVDILTVAQPDESHQVQASEDTVNRRKHRRHGYGKTADYGDQKLSIDKDKSLETIPAHTEQVGEGRQGHKSHHSNNKKSPHGSLTRQSARCTGDHATSDTPRLDINLGARQKQPAQLPPNTSQSGPSSSPINKYRPRSHSPNPKQTKSHTLRPSANEKTSKVQQSRSLDERRTRISRQRNSSFSNLQEESSINEGSQLSNTRLEHGTTQTPYSRCTPAPPTITLRRPSQTCLPVDHGLKCSDPLFQASLSLEVALPPLSQYSPLPGTAPPPTSPLSRPVSSHQSPEHLTMATEDQELDSRRDNQGLGINKDSDEAARTCFCGYFIEKQTPAHTTTSTSPSMGAIKKVRRCKFCRSKAKYLPGQRSLDAVSAKIFRRKKTPESSRRAASEDRYSQDDSSQDPVPVFRPEEDPSSSSSTNIPSSRPSPTYSSLRRPYPFRRQERMDTEESFSANLNEARLQTPLKPPSTLEIPAYFEAFPSDIRDYHHIPGPAPDIPPQPQPRFPHGLTVNLGRDLPLPRQRSSATPATSPGEFQGASTRSLRIGDIGRVHSAPPAIRRQEVYPTSPPPAYDEVLKQPRPPPPTYDEAQMFQRSPNCQERSASEERGMAGTRRGFAHSPHSLPGSRASSTPRHGRGQNPLARAPAQDIPDIYWEQAARELDFCTCRKCQARYRQYFEAEDPISPVSSDSLGQTIIPMETQVLMQEIFTDGMAFCSLM